MATDPSITPAREHAAWEILRARRLCLRSAESLWRVENAKGQAVEAQGYSDPIQALEAAERALQAAETRAEEKRSEKVLSALQHGTYMPWPRQGQSQGQSQGQTEWNILKTSDGSEVEVDGKISWNNLQTALQNIVKLVEVEAKVSSSSSSNSSSSNNKKDT